MSMETPPHWLNALLARHFRPYIATSRKLLPHLNTKPFGVDADIFLMDDADDAPFMEAYLLSNSLSFSSPNLKMPHWVLIDCALMQTAVVGFTLPKADVPSDLRAYYEKDEKIDFTRLSRIPVSGQISATNIDQASMTGISLFSLGKQLHHAGKLGLLTKTLSLEVYGARRFPAYYGIAQYHNPSLRVHGRFTKCMEIHQPIVLLHPMREMTFIYKMALDYDAHTIDTAEHETVEPTFWLNAYDTEQKRVMEHGIKNGKRYIIAPPYSVTRDENTLIPIIEKDC